MKIYIKNMVCDRCKMVVKSELEKLNLNPISVELGEVVIERDWTIIEKEQLEKRFNDLGFEIIDDKKSRLIEKIKKHIINLIYRNNDDLKVNLSDYLSEKIHHEYNYLSHLFSEIEGITIEKYYIAQKIERVKELLVYDELSLTEIAYQLNYSSVAHLSTQFKKLTGLTPSYFKNIRSLKRKSIDQV